MRATCSTDHCCGEYIRSACRTQHTALAVYISSARQPRECEPASFIQSNICMLPQRKRPQTRSSGDACAGPCSVPVRPLPTAARAGSCHNTQQRAAHAYHAQRRVKLARPGVLVLYKHCHALPVWRRARQVRARAGRSCHIGPGARGCCRGAAPAHGRARPARAWAAGRHACAGPPLAQPLQARARSSACRGGRALSARRPGRARAWPT